MRNRADKKLQTDRRRTDGRTDQPTDKLTPIYPPNRVLEGIIILFSSKVPNNTNFYFQWKIRPKYVQCEGCLSTMHFCAIWSRSELAVKTNGWHGRHFNPFPHNDTYWRPWETNLLKTLWEKEKLLITSNFSFSHSVFYLLDNFLPFSSNLKFSSANFFSLEKAKICRLVID